MTNASQETPLALVTGASRGIGAAIAKRLAQAGYYVLINYTSREDRAKAVLEEIESQKGQGALLRFDVGNPEQVEEAFKGIASQGKPLRVLVNNAGITADALLLRLKNEDLRRTIATDLEGAIYCTREAAKLMIKARVGSIIQISSVVGESGNPGQSAYAAAKSGLIGFSKAVAKELASRKIRVNVITPGFISTDMTEGLTEAQKEAILRTIPSGELGQPEDVAHLAAFLASPESRYITGQVIGINGGMYM